MNQRNSNISGFEDWFNSRNNVDVMKKQYDKKEVIVSSYKESSFLYYIISGKAKIYTSNSDGSQSIIQFLNPGDLIGDFEMLDINQVPREVVACSSVECAAIPFSVCKEQLLDNPDFTRKLSEYLALKLYKRTDVLSSNLKHPLINRLSALLVYESIDSCFYEDKLSN